MYKSDARKLSHTELTDMRHRAVAAVQRGESPVKVARVLGVGLSTVYGWLAKYRQGGHGNLDAKKRGGRPPKLDGPSLKGIYDLVTLKQPEQLKFPFALWTSQMIREAIRQRFGVSLSKTSVCRLLHQLGLSPQKPLWRAYQKDPARIKKWLEEDYPEIKRQARKCGGCILFGDEAGVRSDFHSGTTWAKRGQTPVVTTTGARFSLNIISAVSARGDMRFMTVKGTVNGKVFVDFLKRLMASFDRPVHLIVDGHPSHKAKVVSRYVAASDGRLNLHFLPGYSPELNPDEQVWNDLKNNRLGRMAITGPDQMKSAVISHLQSLQRRPERVQSFFQMPDTLYAS